MATDAWPSADAEAVDPEKVTLIRSGESENLLIFSFSRGAREHAAEIVEDRIRHHKQIGRGGGGPGGGYNDGPRGYGGPPGGFGGGYGGPPRGPP